MTCNEVWQIALALAGEATDSALFTPQALGLLGIAIRELTPAAQDFALATDGVRIAPPAVPAALTAEFPLPEPFAVPAAYRFAAGILTPDSPELAARYETRFREWIDGAEARLPAVAETIRDCYR